MSAPVDPRRAVTAALRAVASETGTPVSRLRRPSRRPDRRARHLVAYLAVTACSVRQCLAAPHLGMSRANLCRELQRIEDGRDDPDFDAFVTRLETRTLEAVA